MALRLRRGGNGLDAWPGYVDALSTLLMVTMFVLLVFVLAQAFQGVALSKRNAELQTTNENLIRERERNETLRGSVSRLNRTLADGESERTALLAQVRSLNTQSAAALAERDRLSSLLKEVETAAAAAAIANKTLTQRADAAELTGGQLKNELAAAESRMREMRAQMAALDRTVKADKATIDATLSELARLVEQVRGLTALRDELERQVKTAVAATLTEEQKRRALESQLGEDRKIGETARARVAMLNQENDQLKRELAVSEKARTEEQSRTAGLTEQLNLALAAKVEELKKYRSDFFGKLRQVLAGRPGIEIVGDRFLFQSEVLFGVSSAELTTAGIVQMAELAETIRTVMNEIPSDVNWVLRVDGHTDPTPIATFRFPSNWELWAARAITVVKFLTTHGIPPRHLAATGFGEFQPVDMADTPAAYARNRRIELRLTDR